MLTYLESKSEINFDFNLLSSVVSDFENLKKNYDWGTSLPYMFSGAYSFPQKEVMEWVGTNRYSLSSILNALNNKKLTKQDNLKLPVLKKEKKYSTAIIIGGGKSSLTNKEGIEKYLQKQSDVVLVHVGARNIKNYSNFSIDQFYALVGVEDHNSLKDINVSSGNNKCIYGPFPRLMGTHIPENLVDISLELDEIDFTSASKDSPFVIGIQLALNLGAKQILLVGFDGYNTNINQNQFLLAQENQKIIDDFNKDNSVELISLNPTKYSNIKLSSIYSLFK